MPLSGYLAALESTLQNQDNSPPKTNPTNRQSQSRTTQVLLSPIESFDWKKAIWNPPLNPKIKMFYGKQLKRLYQRELISKDEAYYPTQTAVAVVFRNPPSTFSYNAALPKKFGATDPE
ncbi:hypothetical protein YC2023_089687 [Brassica napus]